MGVKFNIMHQLVPSDSDHLRKADTVSVDVNVNGNSGIVDTRDTSTKSEGNNGYVSGCEGVVDEILIDGDERKEEENVEIMEWLNEVEFEGYYDHFVLNGYQSLKLGRDIKERRVEFIMLSIK